MRRNLKVKGKFGVFVGCQSYGRWVVAMVMAHLHLHHRQWGTTMFTSKPQVVKDQLWLLQMHFFIWPNLCFLLEEDLGLILPTSYIFLVSFSPSSYCKCVSAQVIQLLKLRFHGWWCAMIGSKLIWVTQSGCMRLKFVVSVDEPGKQVRGAIDIKNTSKSHVAFKVWNMSLIMSDVWYKHVASGSTLIETI